VSESANPDTAILWSEQALDDVFGPTPKTSSRPVKTDWLTIDPLSWPVCHSCGERIPSLLVERGHSCHECFHTRMAKVIRHFRPLRRGLPDGRKLELVA
jgi:DNA-directed RNA polymerase subunit RPC12/RpoP